MLNSSVLDFHRIQLSEQGFTILVASVKPTLIMPMMTIVSEAQKSELVDGDNSTHSWKEITIDPPLLWGDMVASIDLEEITSEQLTRMVQWLNVYEKDEFIGTHIDAGGELQLMIPIALPPPGQGGELWINQKDCVLPVGVGDVLVFRANNLRHGTTATTSGKRISLNCRIWFN